MRWARHWSSTSWAPGAKAAAHRALGARDTVTALGVLLSRIYTLRKQLMHGGATWGSSVNRDQMRHWVGLMGKLVPLVIEIMLDHPDIIDSAARSALREICGNQSCIVVHRGALHATGATVTN